MPTVSKPRSLQWYRARFCLKAFSNNLSITHFVRAMAIMRHWPAKQVTTHMQKNDEVSTKSDELRIRRCKILRRHASA